MCRALGRLRHAQLALGFSSWRDWMRHTRDRGLRLRIALRVASPSQKQTFACLRGSRVVSRAS